MRDFLAGTDGRAKVEDWLPGLMAFSFEPYRDGACTIADAASSIAALIPIA